MDNKTNGIEKSSHYLIAGIANGIARMMWWCLYFGSLKWGKRQVCLAPCTPAEEPSNYFGKLRRWHTGSQAVLASTITSFQFYTLSQFVEKQVSPWPNQSVLGEFTYTLMQHTVSLIFSLQLESRKPQLSTMKKLLACFEGHLWLNQKHTSLHPLTWI